MWVHLLPRARESQLPSTLSSLPLSSSNGCPARKPNTKPHPQSQSQNQKRNQNQVYTKSSRVETELLPKDKHLEVLTARISQAQIHVIKHEHCEKITTCNKYVSRTLRPIKKYKICLDKWKKYKLIKRR